MSSKRDPFRRQAQVSEFQMMLSKEAEIKELYDDILKSVENNRIRKTITLIRDQKMKHMAYVKIMISLLGVEGSKQAA